MKPAARLRGLTAMRSLLLATGLLALASTAHASGLDQLHAFLDGTKTARGTFHQTVTNAQGRTTQKSSGSFAFARPGKFRWSYDKPYDQLIVGDGTDVWVYDKDLNQVMVRKLDAALGSTPAALLAGDNALERSFDIGEGAAANGLQYVDAAPKTSETQFKRIRLGFRDNLPRAMTLTDAFGQTTELVFDTMERNPAVPPDAFRFTPPPGADVIGNR
jgi:outer membrane lipoprotein carrier protein